MTNKNIQEYAENKAQLLILGSAYLEVIDKLSDSDLDLGDLKIKAEELSLALEKHPVNKDYSVMLIDKETEDEVIQVTEDYVEIGKLLAQLPVNYISSFKDALRNTIDQLDEK